ncbi:hypothetical protein [Methylicorpusculum sp.]|uniref:hypothetical protein n=1 Tax=Methylicorpusculum sp. TaxID=2713644 RepID=UPI002727062F|nr:hypothetical protein [Methylicorpusculum sp.]MDO8843734.1 hypothetical protein [Methylicorpusculum sp.]
MIALLYFVFFFLIYLPISIWVIRKSYRFAKVNYQRGWLGGLVAALIMYNLVFWDLIPTLIMYKYYCDTQAGFFVYKTPNQWKIENPDLTTEDLKPLGKNKEMLWDFPVKGLISDPSDKVLMINQRIYLDGDIKRNILYPLPIHKTTQFIADSRDNQKLAKLVTYSSGYGNMWTSKDFSILQLKRWLVKSYCGSYKTVSELERRSGYKAFIKQVIELGE